MYETFNSPGFLHNIVTKKANKLGDTLTEKYMHNKWTLGNVCHIWSKGDIIHVFDIKVQIWGSLLEKKQFVQRSWFKIQESSSVGDKNR